MWETAFSLQYGLYGRRAFHFAGSLDNFYAKQHDDGYICREINEQDGHDFFEKFAPGSTGPNLLPWAEWRYYRQTGDETRLHEVFWPMLAYHRWLRRHRTWRNGGYWGTGRSAGSGGHVPNAGADYHGHHIWLEPTLHACLNCFYLTQIGESVGAGDILAELHREREQLLRLITDQLLDRDDQFLHDLGPDGQFAPAKSIGAYWALFDPSLLPGKLQEGFLAHLKDETAFGRQHPLPSLSANSPGYSGKRWDGGVWSPTNYLVLKGLRALGWHKLAHKLASEHLKQVADVYVRTDTLWEYYAPDETAPGEGARPNYVGWTGLTPIAMLIEEIIGIQIDWPLRRIYWDRRLNLDEPYGVENLPLGTDGVVSLLADAERVTVETTVPFTLTVQDRAGKVQLPVSPGKTEFEL